MKHGSSMARQFCCSHGRNNFIEAIATIATVATIASIVSIATIAFIVSIASIATISSYSLYSFYKNHLIKKVDFDSKSTFFIVDNKSCDSLL